MLHSVSEPLQSYVVFPNPSHHSFCVEPGNYTTFTPKDQGCAVQDCCEWLPSAPLKPSHASRDRDPAPATFPEQPTLVGQLFARFTTTLSRPHFDHTHTHTSLRSQSVSFDYIRRLASTVSHLHLCQSLWSVLRLSLSQASLLSTVPILKTTYRQSL